MGGFLKEPVKKLLMETQKDPLEELLMEDFLKESLNKFLKLSLENVHKAYLVDFYLKCLLRKS